jgi:hypothetical protein
VAAATTVTMTATAMAATTARTVAAMAAATAATTSPRKRGCLKGSKDKEFKKRRQKATGDGDTTATGNYEIEGIYASLYIASRALESLKYLGFNILSVIGVWR